jgi:peptidoglycan hydrolase-like protein with peptidoglycan-binding domain
MFTQKIKVMCQCKECSGKEKELLPEFEGMFGNEFEMEINSEFGIPDFISDAAQKIVSPVLDGAQTIVSPFYKWIVGGSSSANAQTSSAREPYTEADANVGKSTLGGIVKGVGDVMGSFLERMKVQNFVANGTRNENALSDMVFFNRHPELGYKKLHKAMPNFEALSKEWLTIRNNIVRPILFNNKNFETAYPEMEFELMDETASRGNKAYIKWVQESLNKILGLTLATDGNIGVNTRSAIRSFQSKNGLGVDGKVGDMTEAAIKKLLLAPVSVTPAYTMPNLTETQKLSLIVQGGTVYNDFLTLRKIISTYTGTAIQEADRGLRILLNNGIIKSTNGLLPEIIDIANMTTFHPGWSISVKPLLVGNILYNLARPETINQGGTDRLGGTPDPTCFSACTQMLLARRFPLTYVRYLKQLLSSSACTFAGGGKTGVLTFKNTSLYKSLDSVLLQTAFDTYFKTKAFTGGKYKPGDELKVQREVFGYARPPKYATSGTDKITQFRKAFITKGGNTRKWELINIVVNVPDANWTGHHSVVISRFLNGRVYFYNPWANEEEKNTMFGNVPITISGNGENPAESSMTQADFEGQVTIVFHN